MSPTYTWMSSSSITASSAPAPSLAASCCTPTGQQVAEISMRRSDSSAGSTEPSEPSVAHSAAVRRLSLQKISFASRSSLQLRIPTLRHSAVAAS
eukprot:scaffold65577_cov66-Phaeocystis_antarctica.AAC.3